MYVIRQWRSIVGTARGHHSDAGHIHQSSIKRTGISGMSISCNMFLVCEVHIMYIKYETVRSYLLEMARGSTYTHTHSSVSEKRTSKTFYRVHSSTVNFDISESRYNWKVELLQNLWYKVDSRCTTELVSRRVMSCVCVCQEQTIVYSFSDHSYVVSYIHCRWPRIYEPSLSWNYSTFYVH